MTTKVVYVQAVCSTEAGLAASSSRFVVAGGLRLRHAHRNNGPADDEDEERPARVVCPRVALIQAGEESAPRNAQRHTTRLRQTLMCCRCCPLVLVTTSIVVFFLLCPSSTVPATEPARSLRPPNTDPARPPDTERAGRDERPPTLPAMLPGPVRRTGGVGRRGESCRGLRESGVGAGETQEAGRLRDAPASQTPTLHSRRRRLKRPRRAAARSATKAPQLLPLPLTPGLRPSAKKEETM